MLVMANWSLARSRVDIALLVGLGGGALTAVTCSGRWPRHQPRRAAASSPRE